VSIEPSAVSVRQFVPVDEQGVVALRSKVFASLGKRL